MPCGAELRPAGGLRIAGLMLRPRRTYPNQLALLDSLNGPNSGRIDGDILSFSLLTNFFTYDIPGFSLSRLFSKTFLCRVRFFSCRSFVFNNIPDLFRICSSNFIFAR